MKGFAQINSTDGLGDNPSTYLSNCYLSTNGKGEIEFTVLNYKMKKQLDIFMGWEDLRITFTATKIEFCDVGVCIENFDKSVNIIFSENPNESIAKCAEAAIKERKSNEN